MDNEKEKRQFSLKTKLLLAISALAIFAFVMDTLVMVSRGEPINMELLHTVLETLFKVVTSSSDI